MKMKALVGALSVIVKTNCETDGSFTALVLSVSITTATAASSIKWPVTPSRPVIYQLKKVTSGSARSFLPGFYYEENGSYLRFCPRPEIKMLAAAGGHVAAGWPTLPQMSLYLVDPAPWHLHHHQHPAFFTMPRMTVFMPPHWIPPSTCASQRLQRQRWCK